MLQRVTDTAKKFQDATRLNLTGMIWLGIAATVIGGCFLTLSKASEDVVRHNGLALYDPARLHWFILHRPDAAVSLAKVVTALGSAPVLIAVVMASAIWLWRRGSHLVIAVAPMLALGIAGVAASLTKTIVGRPRPPIGLHLVTENEPSFPSGHTTDSTAVYLTLALIVAITILRSPKARVAIVAAAMAVSGAIGLSRLTLGVHWPSDVIAGWALGTMVATLVSVTVVLIARTQPADRAEAHGGLRRLIARIQNIALAERAKPLTFTI
jgi:undecaprenyl-diphosphatase